MLIEPSGYSDRTGLYSPRAQRQQREPCAAIPTRPLTGPNGDKKDPARSIITAGCAMRWLASLLMSLCTVGGLIGGRIEEIRSEILILHYPLALFLARYCAALRVGRMRRIVGWSELRTLISHARAGCARSAFTFAMRGRQRVAMHEG